MMIMSEKKPLAIFFHSQSGRSQQLAFAFYQGAKSIDDIFVGLHRAMDANVNDLLNASAWVFIGPENFSAISGNMKAFLDRSYYAFDRADQGRGMAYMLVVNSGNDGSQCVKKMQAILSGMRANEVQAPVIVYGDPTKKDLAAMYECGEGFATAVGMGVF